MEIQRDIGRQLVASNLPHLYLASPLRVPLWNFAEIVGVRKLESLGSSVALLS